MQRFYEINKKTSNLLANFLKVNKQIIQINTKSYASQAGVAKKHNEDKTRSIYFLTKFDPNETVIASFRI